LRELGVKHQNTVGTPFEKDLDSLSPDQSMADRTQVIVSDLNLYDGESFRVRELKTKKIEKQM
jgi:hypothetical protein